MTEKERIRLSKLYRYVYDTPANSPEREKRLAELTDEDSEKLWNFHCEVMNGTIKVNAESEGNKMDYEKWRALQKTQMYEDSIKVKNFESENPGLASAYKQRSIAEDVKRREIMSIKDPEERQMAIAKNVNIFYQQGINTI